ncbi:tetratricopeptide repeat protein [Fervidobacterium islandicum]|uniref:tetratricopeptide repeat protein n=1 Tax=Fervidobacterium islandicum TaxID=2423 RepID=UPI003A61B11D
MKVFSKFLLTSFFTVFLFISVFGNVTSEELNKMFYEARRDYDVEKILKVIKTIEGTPGFDKDARLLTILADAYMEYGVWGAPDKEKERLYENARKYAEMALKLDPKNGRASYVAGAAIGRLAKYKGIFQSVFMLGDFDRYIDNAIKLLNENDEEQKLYKSFALIASGMRYRDVPWPFYNYKRSEELLNSALKITPNYPNIYLELGYLYLKTGDKAKAKEMFEKVVSGKAYPWLIKTHEDAVKSAQEELKNLK